MHDASAITVELGDPLDEFIVAASGHSVDSMERAQAILAVHPEVARGNIYAAAILGDEPLLRRHLDLDPAIPAGSRMYPHSWFEKCYL